MTLKVKFDDFEIITRSRSAPVVISSRSDLERLSIKLLQNEMPVPRPVRLLGVLALPRYRATNQRKNRNSACRSEGAQCDQYFKSGQHRDARSLSSAVRLQSSP